MTIVLHARKNVNEEGRFCPRRRRGGRPRPPACESLLTVRGGRFATRPTADGDQLRIRRTRANDSDRIARA